ncbi:hypothetical protein ElyMa_005746800 [Elysia marginata]|uniref:Uncharacterized protein n=1 Tax=Elysia marginata TaxID=1093978 RepID=A0AAV4FM63_9GAST|nr:hypothetical protein ElyMa_005746800 [Elysia marginata]
MTQSSRASGKPVLQPRSVLLGPRSRSSGWRECLPGGSRGMWSRGLFTLPPGLSHEDVLKCYCCVCPPALALSAPSSPAHYHPVSVAAAGSRRISSVDPDAVMIA